MNGDPGARVDNVQALLDAGANPNAPHEGMTPLARCLCRDKQTQPTKGNWKDRKALKAVGKILVDRGTNPFLGNPNCFEHLHLARMLLQHPRTRDDVEPPWLN